MDTLLDYDEFTKLMGSINELKGYPVLDQDQYPVLFEKRRIYTQGQGANEDKRIMVENAVSLAFKYDMIQI